MNAARHTDAMDAAVARNWSTHKLACRTLRRMLASEER